MNVISLKRDGHDFALSGIIWQLSKLDEAPTEMNHFSCILEKSFLKLYQI